MAPKDKIIKATWNIFQSAKDTVSKNVLTAVREEKVKIDPAVVQQLLTILNLSIEESFQKSYTVFDREINTALSEQTPTKKNN